MMNICETIRCPSYSIHSRHMPRPRDFKIPRCTRFESICECPVWNLVAGQVGAFTDFWVSGYIATYGKEPTLSQLEEYRVQMRKIHNLASLPQWSLQEEDFIDDCVIAISEKLCSFGEGFIEIEGKGLIHFPQDMWKEIKKRLGERWMALEIEID